MKTILFHSYKGGSGKTLASSNVADILAKNGLRTLLIEADFTMPSFQNIYTQYSPDVFFNDYLNQDEKPLDFFIYPDSNADLGLIYCTLDFKLSDNTMGADQEWYLSKIEQLDRDLNKLDYDVVIFDSGPGFNLFLVNTLVFADEIILVSRPDFNSFKGLTFLLDEIYSIIAFKQKVHFSVIFNQIPQYAKMNDLIDKWEHELHVKFPFLDRFYRIKFDPKTSYLNAIQEVVLPEDTNVRKILKNVVKEIV